MILSYSAAMVIPRDSIEYISANVPELSVSDLSNALKRTVEDSFGRVRVRGELSKVAFPASGHMYSALKDDGAVIDAVCWRGQLSKLRIKPEEGLEVICTGRLTTYPARSSYQLIIEQMELAGVGAILKMIEDRRVKLAAEGLFNEDRKRPLPFLPSVIGVITSPTGAVIRDILHRLSDRFPVHVVIWPVNVQGERAAADVAAAITGFNALPADGSIPRPDVLIVARGGGSIEDLMPFNEENVVRAAAASTIPLISAVGHETDTTLIDFASDKRAPTPTAAAEFAVPVRDELNAAVAASALHLDQAVRRRLRDARARLDTLSARLGSPASLIDLPSQRLDQADGLLRARMARVFDGFVAQLSARAAGLRTPSQMISDRQRHLEKAEIQLIRAYPARLDRSGAALDRVSGLLDALSFTRVLARGYAVVRGHDGRVVQAGANLMPGTPLDILFGDGATRRADIASE